MSVDLPLLTEARKPRSASKKRLGQTLEWLADLGKRGWFCRRGSHHIRFDRHPSMGFPPVGFVPEFENPTIRTMEPSQPARAWRANSANQPLGNRW